MRLKTSSFHLEKGSPDTKSNKVVSKVALVSNFNSFPASGDFCRLLITFANTLDPDQNVGPDLDPNCLDSDGIPERYFWKM